MHFSFALEPGDAQAESPSVCTDRVPETLIRVKNCPKSERQHRACPKTRAHHSGVLQNVLFVQTGGRAIKLAHDHRELPARIAEHRGSIYALNAFQDERPPCTCSIGEVLFSQAIRVPGHTRSLQAGQRQTCFSVLGQRFVSEPRKKGQLTHRVNAKPRVQRHLNSGESKNATLSWQPVATRIGNPASGVGPPSMLASGRDREEDRQADVQNETDRNANPRKPKTCQVRDRPDSILTRYAFGRFMRRRV